ncbi:hypothetical protein GGC47_003280 [Bosea sp. OAE752]|uniref:YARHG domain-containing protein n=1 Tax=Bosea spartocytisi TaxID=2773451 RepID=A0A927E7W1_9HYPH|nr:MULTISPECIES: hypothetical protein [Bosea]MBD3844940.1 hypothetical protein [Bosea spartocytisi]MCT4471142.1 hypothetical protein [Bosea spartocytisi]
MMMRRLGAVVLAGGFSMLLGASAYAASSSTALPPPDPTAKNLTPYMIQLRAFDACLITQSRLLNTTREAVHTPCSCYAKGTVNAMSKDEIQAFRDTGYFNDTAREKGLRFIDQCKLKRPI